MSSLPMPTGLRKWAKKRVGLPPNDQARDEWIQGVLSKIPPGSRILDAGAGEMKYKKFCAHLNYVSQDFGQYDGQGNGDGLHPGQWNTSKIDILCDITAIPEPNGSFDAILCSEVLEHLPSPVEALRELARLLKPGGQLILTSPFASLTHFAPFHFYSGFNRYFYQKWLVEFGLESLEISPNGNFFDYLRQELIRTKDVSNEYCEKRSSFSVLEYGALWILLKALKRFSKEDRHSDKLLCFGYHVLAVKKKGN